MASSRVGWAELRPALSIPVRSRRARSSRFPEVPASRTSAAIWVVRPVARKSSPARSCWASSIHERRRRRNSRRQPASPRSRPPPTARPTPVNSPSSPRQRPPRCACAPTPSSAAPTMTSSSRLRGAPMAHRLTSRRLAALRAAVAHPRGNINPRVEIAPGVKAWLTAADEIALEELGCLGGSIDDCGHVQGSADRTEHRAHPHLFRITISARARPRSQPAGQHQLSVPAESAEGRVRGGVRRGCTPGRGDSLVGVWPRTGLRRRASQRAQARNAGTRRRSASLRMRRPCAGSGYRGGP